MKKAILSMLLVGGSYALFAQDSTLNNTSTNNASTSTNDYNAYGTTSVNIPYTVQRSYMATYPNNTNIVWMQRGDWYYTTTNNSGRYTHLYYDSRGTSWTVALPVTQNYVPDEVIGRVSNMFGPTIYDITTLHGMENKTIYQVRTIDNGVVSAKWIGEDGSAITDPYRVETATIDMNNQSLNTTTNNSAMDTNTSTNTNTNTNTSTNMNTNTNTNMNSGEKTKIKTKNSDGTETKTKIKDGQVKKTDQ